MVESSPERRNNGSSSRRLVDWIPVVYNKACRHAKHMLQDYGGLDAPGEESLVHQAVGKLLTCAGQSCETREHALALLVQRMRWVLVDHVRNRVSLRQGGTGRGTDKHEVHVGSRREDGQFSVHARHKGALADGYDIAEEADDPPDWSVLDLIALDEAMDRLRSGFPRQASVVELRFLLGLSVKEVAEELGMSLATIKTDSAFAKKWLRQRLDDRTGSR